MSPLQLLALAYAAVTAAVVGFQLALAAGAPWGDLAMGGRYPGRMPGPMRVAAIVQAALLGGLALVVADAAQLLVLGWSDEVPWLPWVPVVVSAISVVMNAASRSPRERRLWVPGGVILLLTSLAVAALPRGAG